MVRCYLDQTPYHSNFKLLDSHDIRPTSVIELKVWNATQSKKKGKKRQLVASASHTLSDLLQRTKVYKTTRSKGVLPMTHINAQDD